MSETTPYVQEEQSEEPILLSPEEEARLAIWHEFLTPLHEHLRAHAVTFGEHSGSSYDRYIHVPYFVEFIAKQSGEQEKIESAFPPKSRRSTIAGRPTSIVSPASQVSELLKPLRDEAFHLNKTKRTEILRRARETYTTRPSIFYGLALYEAIDKETSFGAVTLDAVAALTLAHEKMLRQRKAS